MIHNSFALKLVYNFPSSGRLFVVFWCRPNLGIVHVETSIVSSYPTMLLLTSNLLNLLVGSGVCVLERFSCQYSVREMEMLSVASSL